MARVSVNPALFETRSTNLSRVVIKVIKVIKVINVKVIKVKVP